MSEVLIEFDIPDRPLSMNDSAGSQHLQRARRATKNHWLEAAHYAAVAAFPGKGPAGRAMPPCEVYVSIPFEQERRRDPHNYYPTVKAIIDGIVQAGVWPDDNPDWVHTNEPTLRVAKGNVWRERVYVRLVPREAA